MNFVDNGYLAAINAVPRPDYWQNFAQMYGLLEQSPWSYRNQRKEAIENYQMWMQQQKFQADLAQQQQEMAIKNQLLPYQIARYKQLAGGGIGGDMSQDEIALDYVRRLKGIPASPRQEIVEPDLPIDSEIPVSPSLTPITQPPQNINFDSPFGM